jgi:hypothetical protein
MVSVTADRRDHHRPAATLGAIVCARAAPRQLRSGSMNELCSNEEARRRGAAATGLVSDLLRNGDSIPR